MQEHILVSFFFELFGEHLDALPGTAENYALVDDEFGVDGVQGHYLLLLFHQNVVVGQPDQHELVH